MKSKIPYLLNKKQFFNVCKSTDKIIEYFLEKPAQLLLTNIYTNWLRYINIKTKKVMSVHILKGKNDLHNIKHHNSPFGIIKHKEFEMKKMFEYTIEKKISQLNLEFELIIPQQDTMKYFTQWQRYRKYWWSSITTTPSLFAIGDVKQGDTEANVDIVAKFHIGTEPVEHISMKNDTSTFNRSASLTCTMSLEKALFILLLDGLSENSSDEYLRLHRKIAPYKMSFALSYEDLTKKEDIKDLAALLFHHLKLNNISAYLPDFSVSFEDQIKENLYLGIPYTAILKEKTLEDGIFYLMNSNTTLKEQLHVADFHSYAELICNHK